MSDQPAADQQEEILEDILPEFLVEADDLLESLNALLLKLDEGVKEHSDQDAPDCDKELLNEVFRSAHTLKGLSGMFGFTDINQLTHKVENIFDAARSDQLPVTEDIVDVIFRAIDHVSAMVDGLRNGEVGGVDAEAIQSEIQAVLEATGTAKSMGGEVDLDAAMAEAATENQSDAAATEEIDLDAAFAEALAERNQTQTDAEISAEAESAEVVSTENENGNIVEETTEESMENSAKEIVTTDTAIDDPFADMVDDENIPANYLSIFVDETETSLDSLTEILLDGVDEKIAEHLLVICHRIKGSAASIGLNRAAALGHVMEDLLQDLEEEQREPTAEMADALLSCIDALRGHINDLKQGVPNVFEFRSAYDRLIAARDSSNSTAPEATASTATTADPVETRTITETLETAATPATELDSPETTAESLSPVQAEAEVVEMQPITAQPVDQNPLEEQTKAAQQFDANQLAKVAAVAPAGTEALAVHVEFRPDLILAGLKARLLFEKLSHFGDVFYCDPPEEELDELEELSQLVMGVSTDAAVDAIQTDLSVEGVQQLHFESIAAESIEVKEVSPILPETAAKAALPAVEVPATQKTSPTTPKAAAVAATEPTASKEPVVKKEAAPIATKNARSSTPATETASKPVETVRVDIDRLDQLMNMAGQLVINKARFSQINASMKRSVGSKSNSNTMNDLLRSVEQLRHGFEDCSDQCSFEENLDSMQSCLRRVHTSMELLQHQLENYDEVRLSINDLSEAVHQLDRVADGIQKGVMDTRMVPIGPLFGRFKRVIRDISHSSGKKIRLEIRGEHTELDKRMIDELGDPLIHIVRNSADHGIESPEDREAAGKPVEGTVILDAAHRGNSIVIEIIDDGKGLDTNRIREKAIEKGVISEADAEKLTDYQIHQLIWEPGFSTAGASHQRVGTRDGHGHRAIQDRRD